MRNVVYSFLTVGLLFTAACGPTKNNPIKKYEEQGLVPATSMEAANGKPKIEYVYVDKEIPVTKEKIVEVKVPTIVTKEVPKEVIKYVTKEVEQTFSQGQVFQVDGKSSAKFTEGKENIFDFKVRVLQGKVKFKVAAANIPDGAKLIAGKQDVNSGEYQIVWTPKAGLIPAGESEIENEMQIQLTNLEFVSEDKAQNESAKKVFDVISKTKSIPVVVNRSKEKPTILVQGLSDNVNVREGEVVPFSVEVTAPGSGTTMAPEVYVGYDISSPGNNPVTAGGIRSKGSVYVEEDHSKGFPQQIGANKWRFNYTFDTANNPIQIQLDKDKKVVQNPSQLLVQVTFQSVSAAKTSSEKKTLKFAINLKQKPAQVVSVGVAK